MLSSRMLISLGFFSILGASTNRSVWSEFSRDARNIFCSFSAPVRPGSSRTVRIQASVCSPIRSAMARRISSLPLKWW